MGMISRSVVPRKIRRAVHPVRTVKRAATPTVVKQARRAKHPISNATYSVERSLNARPPRTSRARHRVGVAHAQPPRAYAPGADNGPSAATALMVMGVFVLAVLVVFAIFYPMVGVPTLVASLLVASAVALVHRQQRVG
jgi:hypothetical protein